MLLKVLGTWVNKGKKRAEAAKSLGPFPKGEPNLAGTHPFSLSPG